MKHTTALMRIVLLATAIGWLAGCASSPPSRFYTLNSLAVTEGKQPAANVKPVSIGVLPVEVPDYLDRPQIVTRYGANQLKYASFDRWAGSLSDNMSTVLAENLAALLGTGQVFVNPGHAEKTDLAVLMRVIRLDCMPGDQVLLKAQWTVFTEPDYKSMATGVSNITEKLRDNQFDSIAAALSRALGRVSRDIAEKIPR
jgi:uncharacterized lipoprotein YmbA